MTISCPSVVAICWLRILASVSAGPPGANGTTSVIGRSGNVAEAGATPASSVNSTIVNSFMRGDLLLIAALQELRLRPMLMTMVLAKIRKSSLQMVRAVAGGCESVDVTFADHLQRPPILRLDKGQIVPTDSFDQYTYRQASHVGGPDTIGTHSRKIESVGSTICGGGTMELLLDRRAKTALRMQADANDASLTVGAQNLPGSLAGRACAGLRFQAPKHESDGLLSGNLCRRSIGPNARHCAANERERKNPSDSLRTVGHFACPRGCEAPSSQSRQCSSNALFFWIPMSTSHRCQLWT